MRDATPYTQRREWVAPAGYGIDVERPVAGHYRLRLRSGAIAGAVRIWHGPPHDPDTGEEMDRGWRWQAEFLGSPIAFDRCWPTCAGSPIAEQEYAQLCQRKQWAERHAPNSSYADPMKKRDPLDRNEPLPF